MQIVKNTYKQTLNQVLLNAWNNDYDICTAVCNINWKFLTKHILQAAGKIKIF